MSPLPGGTALWDREMEEEGRTEGRTKRAGKDMALLVWADLSHQEFEEGSSDLMLKTSVSHSS